METKLSYKILVTSALSILTSFSADAAMKIGMNSNKNSDYNTMLPCGEIFSCSREFQVGSLLTSAGWSGPLRNDSRFQMDANGYPIEVKSSGPHVETLMVRDIQGGKYPKGKYTLVIDGSGTVEIGLDGASANGGAPLRFQGPGTYTFNVTSTSSAGIHLAITQTGPTNHITKIRVYMPGLAPGYAEEPWNPEYVNYLKDMAAYRFMNFMNINSNSSRDWSDRNTPDYQTQSTGNGFSWEYQIKLINLLPNTAGWFMIPLNANENYIRNVAKMLRDNLVHKDKPVYVEIGNEIWNRPIGNQNSGFWSSAMGSTGNYDLVWKAQADLYNFAYSILIEEFEKTNERSRLRTVLGTQKDNSDPSYGPGAQVAKNLRNMNADVVDVISPSGYMPSLNGRLTCSTTASQIAQMQLEYLNGDYINQLSDHKRVRDTQNSYFGRDDIEMSLYEGGQHTLALGDSCLVKYLDSIKEAPAYAAPYQRLMEISNDIGVELFMFYRDGQDQTLLADNQFGHQKYLGQPLSELTRFREILSFMDSTYPNRDYYGESETTQPACAADFNADGVFDNGDIGTFIQLFLAQDMRVDLNKDGVVDHGDISAMMAACY